MLMHAQSAALFARSQRVLAGGVSSDVRKSEVPFPLFFRCGKGSRIVDVDGNEYIDYILGQGPLLLGHNPRPVLDAVHEQIEQGLIYAGQHSGELDFAELLTRIIPCAERVRFNSSGSEAVISALRVARAYRGRTLVVKFEGHWHGWYDSVFVSTAPTLEAAGLYQKPTSVLPSRGQVRSSADNVLVMPWNDLPLIQELFATRGTEIAAVITEPIMCNAGALLPKPGFLQGLRRLCDEWETILIFDEVITGFRLGLGGAQEAFGVVPDLATYAKAIASGFPLSVIAGKAQFMDLISQGQVAHAGTYNSNPVVIAAARATVRSLMEHQESIYQRLYRLGDLLREGLREKLQQRDVPALVGGFGPIVQVTLTQARELCEYRGWAIRDQARYEQLVRELVQRGVRTMARGTWFLSTAHTEADIACTVANFDAALEAIQSVHY